MTDDVKDDGDDFKLDGVTIEFEQDMQDAMTPPEDDRGEPEQEEPEQEESPAEETSPEAQEDTTAEDWREKRIAKQTHKLKRAEEKIRELESRLGGTPAPQAEKLPEVPAYPSADLQYDNPAEFERQVQAREAAIIERARVQAKNEFANESQTLKQQQEVQRIVSEYANRGKEMGLSEDKMVWNEEVLLDAGISQDIGRYIYEDQDGPRIADYLANKPEELAKVAGMSPVRAAEYIVLNVKPRVGQVKPKTSRTPDPVKPVKGSGIVQKDDFDAIVPAGYTID